MNPINLHQIAIEAMRRQGLLPVFALQALQEADNARPAAAQADHGDIADLRQ